MENEPGLSGEEIIEMQEEELKRLNSEINRLSGEEKEQRIAGIRGEIEKAGIQPPADTVDIIRAYVEMHGRGMTR